jgi:predicted permease
MAAISSNATPPRNGWNSRFEILGRPAAEQQLGSINLIGPEYFATLRIPLLEGRVWSETENRNGRHLAVINRSLAQRCFPNGDAIGHSVKVPGFEDRPPAILSAAKIADSWLEIVGIVGDARNDGLVKPIQPAVFVPYTLSMWMGTQILVRTEAAPLTLLHAVRPQLTMVDPEQQSYSTTEDLDSWVSNGQEWQQEHLAAWIFGVFGGLALALAAVGLYSVVSYTVAQRTNEFGIRMALGAQRGDILRMILGQGTRLALVGTGIGIAVSFGLTRLIANQLFGVTATDPVTFLSVAVLIVLVALAACYIPARRAMRVDPVTALRYE